MSSVDKGLIWHSRSRLCFFPLPQPRTFESADQWEPLGASHFHRNLLGSARPDSNWRPSDSFPMLYSGLSVRHVPSELRAQTGFQERPAQGGGPGGFCRCDANSCSVMRASLCHFSRSPANVKCLRLCALRSPSSFKFGLCDGFPYQSLQLEILSTRASDVSFQSISFEGFNYQAFNQPAH
jgi:hypothetical protein